ARGVRKQGSPTGGSVGGASSVFNKRLETICCIFISGITLECLRTRRCVLDASGDAIKSLRTKRRVIGAGGKAEEGTASSLRRVSTGISSIRCRVHRLRVLHRGKADNQDCDENLWHGCFHARILPLLRSTWQCQNGMNHPGMKAVTPSEIFNLSPSN